MTALPRGCAGAAAGGPALSKTAAIEAAIAGYRSQDADAGSVLRSMEISSLLFVFGTRPEHTHGSTPAHPPLHCDTD